MYPRLDAPSAHFRACVSSVWLVNEQYELDLRRMCVPTELLH